MADKQLQDLIAQVTDPYQQRIDALMQTLSQPDIPEQIPAQPDQSTGTRVARTGLAALGDILTALGASKRGRIPPSNYLEQLSAQNAQDRAARAENQRRVREANVAGVKRGAALSLEDMQRQRAQAVEIAKRKMDEADEARKEAIAASEREYQHKRQEQADTLSVEAGRRADTRLDLAEQRANRQEARDVTAQRQAKRESDDSADKVSARQREARVIGVRDEIAQLRGQIAGVNPDGTINVMGDKGAVRPWKVNDLREMIHAHGLATGMTPEEITSLDKFFTDTIIPVWTREMQKATAGQAFVPRSSASGAP